jgi:hypothetical protein
MSDRIRVISPVDGAVLTERPLADDQRIERTLARCGCSANASW